MARRRTIPLYRLSDCRTRTDRKQLGERSGQEPALLDLASTQQELLNIAVGVAIIRVIQSVLCQRSGLYSVLSIKWPNDIYFGDKKVAGILIENAIIGNEIKYSIAGIGLNVNQTTFVSDAPNPVSLKQITGKEYDIERLMSLLFETVQSVLNESEQEVWADYKAHLYRREGWYPFVDKNGTFEARISDVLPTGEIILSDQEGKEQKYHFKQVRYVI